MNHILSRIGGILLLVFATSLLGCSGVSEDADLAKQRMGLGGLARVYGQYMSQHRGRPPRSEKELRKFIESQGAEYLVGLEVETIDELFTSPRDGEPYVVIYGKRQDVVAYEAVGADGKRFYAHNLGGAELVDEAKFQEMVPDAK